MEIDIMPAYIWFCPYCDMEAYSTVKSLVYSRIYGHLGACKGAQNEEGQALAELALKGPKEKE